jgi:hypothetical protein
LPWFTGLPWLGCGKRLCEVWIEAEETVEHCACNNNIAQPDGSIPIDEMNTWFALSTKK